MDEEWIHIEVAAALPQRQLVIALEVPACTTLAEAVARANMAERLPGLVVDEARLGVFGRLRPPDSLLRDGDRVEIYRPLAADPKEVRRQLAELARSGKA